ncbi:hypothetical protein EMPS_00397 [Entomortierella parvispora]|uniref:AMP-activated protein kinase glycogen-binding domain-containing protein n=1 Tax=Entomortierella parvispora TaxID=205924 RepID=A0A9P3LRI4_9FUNG|nr:hypothetical protein EMPS_00397 [Entomortierella parvispora]
MTKPKTSTTAAAAPATVPVATPLKAVQGGHPGQPLPHVGGGASAKTTTAPPPPAQAPNNAQHKAHHKKPSHAGGTHKPVMGHSVVAPPETHHNYENEHAAAHPAKHLSHAHTKDQNGLADGKTHLMAHTFEWKQGGGVVKVTGTFDNWTGSVVMKKVPGNQGRFESIVDLDRTQKVLFKFIVDGQWKCIDGIETEYDQSGNLNNVLRPI